MAATKDFGLRLKVTKGRFRCASRGLLLVLELIACRAISYRFGCGLAALLFVECGSWAARRLATLSLGFFGLGRVSLAIMWDFGLIPAISERVTLACAPKSPKRALGVPQECSNCCWRGRSASGSFRTSVRPHTCANSTDLLSRSTVMASRFALK